MCVYIPIVYKSPFLTQTPQFYQISSSHNSEKTNGIDLKFLHDINNHNTIKYSKFHKY